MKENSTTALTVSREEAGRTPWHYMEDPEAMTTAARFCAALVKSGLAPAAIKTVEQAFYVILAGRELGWGPIYSLRHLAIVEGKPTASGEAILAQILQGGCRIAWRRADATGATLWCRRPDGTEHEESFTEEDARRAGLSGKRNWQTYPQAMHKARCASAMGRNFCPDMTAGISYTPEELGAEINPETGEVLHDAPAILPPAAPAAPPPPTAQTPESSAPAVAHPCLTCGAEGVVQMRGLWSCAAHRPAPPAPKAAPAPAPDTTEGMRAEVLAVLTPDQLTAVVARGKAHTAATTTAELRAAIQTRFGISVPSLKVLTRAQASHILAEWEMDEMAAEAGFGTAKETP